LDIAFGCDVVCKCAIFVVDIITCGVIVNHKILKNIRFDGDWLNRKTDSAGSVDSTTERPEYV
jgi:hypothetical protein